MKHWFRIELSDNVIRTLNRKDYYDAKSWLRNCRRIMVLELNEKENKLSVKEND